MSKEYSLIGDDGESVIDIALGDGVTDISDGYHTFGELYQHRMALTAVLAAERADISWRSKAHHPDDSPMFEGGYFIMGIDTPAGTITYHYKLEHWDDFADVPEWEHAPRWDGATPGDTVTRLLAWAKGQLVPVALTAPSLHVQDAANPLHPVKTDWPETARDLISGDQERIDRHLGELRPE